MTIAMPPEWCFESIVTDLNGVRVAVTVTVPNDVMPKFPGEVGEHAQIAANQAVGRISKFIQSEQEVPF